MKNNPTSIKNGEANKNQGKIQRKISLIKDQQKFTLVPQLELPRFYSSDDKIQKKKLIMQTQQHQNTPLHLNSKKGRINLNLEGPKYSKTQKNETPSKGDPNSLNKVKIIQEKIGAAILKASAKDFKQAKNRQKKIDYHEMIAVEKKSTKQIKETVIHQHKQSNSNKIKYKMASSKKIETERRQDAHQLFVETIQTDVMQQRYNHPKTYRDRDSKLATEQGAKNPLKQKSKILLKNNDLQSEYRSQTKPVTSRNENKLRTLSTFQSIAKTAPKLSADDKQFLKFIELAIKKTTQSHNNLDYPQAFIVTDKSKFQRKFYGMLDQKHQKQYAVNLVHTRLAFYICAHCILQEINTRIMTPLLNKLLQNHQIIINLLNGVLEKQTQKLFSLNKYSTKQLSKKQLTQSRHMQISQIVVETRGSNLFRNNQIIKRQLSSLITTKNFVHSKLFLKMMNQNLSQDPLKDLAEIDKVLKWQVLKMPTKPFLPESISFHRHYLILDLDETLIHYSSSKEVYHIRPFASQFLQNISKYYELTVFTAATKEYADQIINQIDKGDFISHRLYRNHLTFLMGQSLKDLSMLGRNLETTLIVDNLQANFRMHPQNGILIKSWYGEADDSVLSKLQILLIRLVLQFPEDLRKGVAHYANYIQREITQKFKGYSIKYEV